MNDTTLHLLGITIIGSLWYFADLGARRLHHVFVANSVAHVRTRLTGTYSTLLCLMLTTLLWSHFVSSVLCFAASALACLYFCNSTANNSADFWAKRRNRAFAIGLIAVFGMILVNFQTSSVFASTTFAVLTFQRYRSIEILLLRNSMKDLSAVRQKLASLDADRRNLQLVIDSSEPRNTSSIHAVG